jgi:hypothetical protein
MSGLRPNSLKACANNRTKFKKCLKRLFQHILAVAGEVNLPHTVEAAKH